MWIVWRPGSPDPSRPRVALHHDDPAKDRDKTGWLAPPILIAPEHRGMAIAGLLSIDAYNLPAKARAEIEGEVTKTLGTDGARIPATIEA